MLNSKENWNNKYFILSESQAHLYTVTLCTVIMVQDLGRYESMVGQTDQRFL
jgi:hypothetical protein